MLKFKAAAFAVPLLMLLLAVRVHACSCMESGPPCQAFWTTDVVFEGTVTGMSEISKSDKFSVDRVAVKFKLSNVYRGRVVGPNVEIRTGLGGGDCGYQFEKGQKYLVYAWQENNGTLSTGICSRTRPVSEAAEDLAYFRNLPTENSGSRISVKVVKYTLPIKDDSHYDLTALPGVKLTAVGNTQTLEGTTDDKGQFVFVGLTPGKYQVSADLPRGQDNYSKTEVTVIDRGCANLEFVNNAVGKISGRIVDGNGNPVKSAMVTLIDAQDASQESPTGKTAFSQDNGSYELHSIPTGTYILGVNLIGPPNQCQQRAYYTGEAGQTRAGYIEVNAGDELGNRDIQVLPAGPEREIEGVAVWANGKPATYAVIQQAYPSLSHYLPGGQKAVDANGHFILRGVEGCSYQIFAFVYGGRLNSNSDEIIPPQHSEPTTIRFRKDQPPVKLVLTLPGAFLPEKLNSAPSKP